MIESGEMPLEKKKQPSDKEVHVVAKWLGQMLLENDKPGGARSSPSQQGRVRAVCVRPS